MQVCTGFHPEKLNSCDRELVNMYIDSHYQLRSIVAGTGRPEYRAVSYDAEQKSAL